MKWISKFFSRDEACAGRQVRQLAGTKVDAWPWESILIASTTSATSFTSDGCWGKSGVNGENGVSWWWCSSVVPYSAIFLPVSSLLVLGLGTLFCAPWRTTLQLLHTVLSPSYTGVVILLDSTWALPGRCFAECPPLVTLTPGVCPTWTEQPLVISACSLCSPMSLDTGSVHLISLMWLE